MNAEEPICKAWMIKTESDLLNIDNNLSAERIPWDTIYFHSQQAAEKYLKAFLVFHEVHPTRTHDLRAILEECLIFDPSLEFLFSICDDLNFFPAAPRYPGEIIEANAMDGRRMVESAQKEKEAIVERIGGLNRP